MDRCVLVDRLGCDQPGAERCSLVDLWLHMDDWVRVLVLVIMGDALGFSI